MALKKGVCQLLALNKFNIMQWMNTFDSMIFDADGVLWRFNNPINGAPEAFNALRAMGKRAFICTNHSALSREKLFAKAEKMGIIVDKSEIFSSAWALAHYLKERKFDRKVYIVGGQGIVDELKEVGIQAEPIKQSPLVGKSLRDHVLKMPMDPDVGAVVVGVDQHFDVLKLTKACCYLRDPKVLFLATNQDRSIAVTPNLFIPSTGSMVSAVQAIADRPPITCGKPNALMCLHLMRDGVIKPDRTLMVGDTLYTDVLFGYNCGFQTLLVGSGNTTLADVIKAQKSKDPMMYRQIPDLFLPSIADLLKFLPSKNR